MGCCGGGDVAGKITTDVAITRDIVDQIFDLVDSNHDGNINAGEANVLASVMFEQTGLPMNLKSYKALLLAMDSSAPYGAIDKDEFRTFFEKQQDKNSVKRTHPALGLNAQDLSRVKETLESKSQNGSSAFVLATTEASIKDTYTKVRVLGKGKYASVELWKDHSGGKFAAKVFKKQGVSKSKVYDVINEFLMMKDQLNGPDNECHPNLVKLCRMVETPQTMNLLMEVVTGGELYELLMTKKTFQTVEAQWITKQLLRGLSHLHSHNIIHSDLKPENVMVDQVRAHPYNIKIADFGLSEVIVDRSQGFNEWHGSPYYMAPELFRQEHKYDEKVDLWAVGIMMHELFCGQPPIRATTRKELHKNVVTFKGFRKTQFGEVTTMASTDYSKNVKAEWVRFKMPPEAQMVLHDLLKPNFIERPTASLVLRSHDWLKAKSDQMVPGQKVEPGPGPRETLPGRDSSFDTPDFQHLVRVMTRMKAEERMRNLADLPKQPAVNGDPAAPEGGSDRSSVGPTVKADANRQSSTCGNCSVM